MIDARILSIIPKHLCRQVSIDSCLRRNFVFIICVFLTIACARQTPAPVSMLGTQAQEQTDSLYRVSENETVYSIAKNTGVAMQLLIDINQLSPPFTILSGQKLILPKPSTYTVQWDDTVFAIAQAFNVSQSEIVTENNLKSPDYKVSVGQILKIPSPFSPNQRSIFDESISVEYEPAQSWGTSQSNVVESNLPPTRGAVKSQELAPLPQTKTTKTTTPVTKVASAKPKPVKSTVKSIVQKPAKRSSSKFAWPVQGNVISSYGSKKSGQRNDGINIGAARGTPIRSAENGVVAYSGNEIDGYGNLLLIRHSDGYMTAYAHLDKSLVKRGDKITRGQTVAAVGSTGNVTSPQLHFEVRRGSKSLNPKKYLN